MGRRNCSCVGCLNSEVNTEGRVPKVKFYSFPTEPGRREQWIQFVDRINRDGTEWEPTKCSFICSDHFIGGEKSPLPFSPAHNPSMPAGKEATVEDLKRLKEFNDSLKVQPATVGTHSVACGSIDLNENDNLDFPNSVAIQCNLSRLLCFKESTGALIEFSSTYQVELSDQSPKSNSALLIFSQGTQVTHKEEETYLLEIKPKFHQEPVSYNEDEQESLLKTYSKNQPTVKTTEQTPPPIQVLTATDACFKGYQTVAGNPTDLHALAAVTTAGFELLLVCLDNFRPRKMKVEDSLLMFLMKIRHDLPFTALAALFGTDNKTISRYFYLILNHLYVQFEAMQLIPWPTKEDIHKALPPAFQNNEFMSVRCIVDCSEVRVEQPSGLRQQNVLYSSYKKSHTVKFLIAVAPNGLITHILNAYGGHSSDQAITAASTDFLSKLEPGDQVLADKGFPVISASQAAGVVTVIPPRKKRGQAQFSPEQIEETKKIASVRIHVERSIQRMKIFKILKNCLGLHLLPHINKLLRVIGGLVNMQRPLIAPLPSEAAEVDEQVDVEYDEDNDDIFYEDSFDLNE